MVFDFFVILIPLCLSLILNIGVVTLSQKFHFFIDSGTSNKPQRFHDVPVPRAGGLSIFIPFCAYGLFFVFENPSPLVLGLLCGGGIVFLSGIIEDFNGSLSPKLRLLLQCLGGWAFVFLSGEFLSDLGFGISLPAFIAIPFSVFAIVGIINAINIIDGFNGLASGVVLIALACITFVLPEGFAYMSVMYVLMASVLGFWILNFPFGKIFLGDGGAYFLGFLLASLLIALTQNPNFSDGEISPWFGITLLVYPFWEVIFSIYRKKFIKHTSPMQPDKVHMHMLIYKRLTHNNPKTTLFILLCITPFMVFSTFISGQNLPLCMLSFCFICGYMWLYRRLIRFKGRKGYAPTRSTKRS